MLQPRHTLSSPARVLAQPVELALTNVSLWDTIEDVKQMDRFQPLLDLGKSFADAGATFECPIMNYTCGTQKFESSARGARKFS
jgi:hypothetical protein